MGWFSGGNTHTGWRDAKTGEALTDSQARERIAQADREYAERSGQASGKAGGKK